MSMLELMLPPFAACMVLVAMHAYLGIHVIAREVIFVDLSLAQMAALGSTSALLFDVAPDSRTGYAFALSFTTIGAFIFAMTRTRREHRRLRFSSMALRPRPPQMSFLVIRQGASPFAPYV